MQTYNQRPAPKEADRQSNQPTPSEMKKAETRRKLELLKEAKELQQLCDYL